MDTAACERLWREYADRLLLFAASLLGDSAAAEDALQAVFARLLAGDNAPSSESERSYLYQAVRNEALNAMRSRRRSERARKKLFADPDRPEEGLHELRLQIESVLPRLPQDQREAVVLKIWGDLSFPEGASALGVSEKTFEHRYYRGLAALEEMLRGDV